MRDLLRRLLGLGRQPAAPASAEPKDEGAGDLKEDQEESDLVEEADPYDGAGLSPFEEALARELVPLLARCSLPTPGGGGATQLGLPAQGRAAAVLRYGGALGRGQSAESFLLLQDRSRPEPRVLMGITEGNYNAPVSGLAGIIALSTLAQHVCGAHRTRDLEHDLKEGFASAIRRLSDIAQREPPPPLRQWRFKSAFRPAPQPLDCTFCSVTALALSGSTAVLGHIGEGRAYLLRRGEFRRLSADHTVAAMGLEHPPEFPDIPAKTLGGSECQLSDVQLERFVLEPLDTILLGSANLFEGDAAADRMREVLAANAPADSCRAFLQFPEPRARTDRSITAVIARPGSLRRDA